MQTFITSDSLAGTAVGSAATAMITSIVMQSAAFVLIAIGAITLAVVGAHLFTRKK